eukprot:2423009-Pyramimonas_sp.AAC.1
MAPARTFRARPTAALAQPNARRYVKDQPRHLRRAEASQCIREAFDESRASCGSHVRPCLLYTSDAADDTPCVDL